MGRGTAVRGGYGLIRGNGSLTRALKIAALVGTRLNMINQGDRLLGVACEGINWLTFALTYLVPFAVSVYTVASMGGKSLPTGG